MAKGKNEQGEQTQGQVTVALAREDWLEVMLWLANGDETAGGCRRAIYAIGKELGYGHTK